MKSPYDLYWDDTVNPSIALVSYIKLHILSLEQDMEKWLTYEVEEQESTLLNLDGNYATMKGSN